MNLRHLFLVMVMLLGVKGLRAKMSDRDLKNLSNSELIERYDGLGNRPLCFLSKAIQEELRRRGIIVRHIPCNPLNPRANQFARRHRSRFYGGIPRGPVGRKF